MSGSRLADDRTFAEVYHSHFEYAWACLRRLGVAPEAQEDAVQDLFVVVHRRLPAFAGRSSVKTWIFGIARKVAARYRRTEVRRLRRHERLAAAGTDDHAEPGEDELHRREARRLLTDFLAGLDDDRRALFVLHAVEDRSGPEIAEALGLNLNTVYSRLRWIRAELERTLAGHREAALRAARAPERPPEAAQRRVWGALVGPLGGATTTAGGLGAGKLAGAKWAVALVGAAALTVVVAAPPRSGDPPREAASATPGPRVAAPGSTRGAAPPEPATPPRLAADDSPRAAPRRPLARPAAALPAPSTAETLAAETALMGRVRAAVEAGDHEVALSLLAAHAREHPDGALQRERDGFRALALCLSGQTLAGREAAAAFLQAHPPGAALALRVRGACELAGPPGR